MKRLRSLDCGLLVATAVVANLAAQTAVSGAQGLPKTLNHFSSVVIGGVPMIGAKAGAPFSATVTGRVEQQLADGTAIRREMLEYVKRDGTGRIYRQQVRRAMGIDSKATLSFTITGHSKTRPIFLPRVQQENPTLRQRVVFRL